MNNHKSCCRNVRWVCFLLLLIGGSPVKALLFYNAGNLDNTTAPGGPMLDSLPFDTVARVSSTQNITFLEQIRGSAIHLGHGYMLTANHVFVGSTDKVTFDGSTYYEIDNGFTQTQVAANVDMKVFKLSSTPTGIGGVNLHTGGTENLGDAYLVGWGVGRDSTALNSADVGWGDYTTSDKRWGINQPENLYAVGYQSGNYIAIRTSLGTPSGSPAGLGDLEASVNDKDSGSAMFQFLNGRWELIGLATGADGAGDGYRSLFGDDVTASANSHDNYFARISNYSEDIVIAVPELASLKLISLAGLVAVLFHFGKRR